MLCTRIFFNLLKAVIRNFIGDYGQIEMLCSQIQCPAEANPAWRWYGL